MDSEQIEQLEQDTGNLLEKIEEFQAKVDLLV
jgi:hypothetical protein